MPQISIDWWQQHKHSIIKYLKNPWLIVILTLALLAAALVLYPGNQPVVMLVLALLASAAASGALAFVSHRRYLKSWGNTSQRQKVIKVAYNKIALVFLATLIPFIVYIESTGMGYLGNLWLLLELSLALLALAAAAWFSALAFVAYVRSVGPTKNNYEHQKVKFEACSAIALTFFGILILLFIYIVQIDIGHIKKQWLVVVLALALLVVVEAFSILAFAAYRKSFKLAKALSEKQKLRFEAYSAITLALLGVVIFLFICVVQIEIRYLENPWLVGKVALVLFAAAFGLLAFVAYVGSVGSTKDTYQKQKVKLEACSVTAFALLGLFISVTQIEIAQKVERNNDYDNVIMFLGSQSPAVRKEGIRKLCEYFGNAEKYGETKEELRGRAQDTLSNHIKHFPLDEDYQDSFPSSPSEDIQLAINLQLSAKSDNPLKYIKLFPDACVQNNPFIGAEYTIDWSGAYLRGANLEDAELQGAELNKARLQGADLSRAQLQGADLREAYLQGVKLWSTQLQGADLSYAKLQGADLTDTRLQGANLKEAHLQGSELRRAHLQGSNLRRAHLQGSNLRRAYLQGSDLSDAQLQGVTFKDAQAQLQGVNLENTQAQLQEADLSRTQLQGVNLENTQAQLQEADLSRTQLQGVFSDGSDYESFQDRINTRQKEGSELNTVIFDGGVDLDLIQENMDLNAEFWNQTDRMMEIRKALEDLHAKLEERAKELEERAKELEGQEKELEGQEKELEGQGKEVILGSSENIEGLATKRGFTPGKYSEEDAKKWIKEYEDALSSVPPK